MATYKGIKGIHLNTVAGDIGTVALGDIWYNSTLGKIRVAGSTAGAWSSGGNVNNARYSGGSFGTQTAAVLFGGLNYNQSPPSRPYVEEYNGTAWSEVTDITAGTRGAGCGTLTAGLTMPFENSTECYEYDGTDWTAGGDYPAPTGRACIAGTQTAAVGFAGTGILDQSNEYDGSSWTESGDLVNSHSNRSFCGVQTVALCISGGDGASPESVVLNVESYDGSSWTEGANVNTGMSEGSASQQGSTSTIKFSGDVIPGYTVNTEEWDGSSWTEVGNMATGRQQVGGAGTYAAALAAAGYNYPSPAPITNITEEWTGDVITTATVTTS